MTKKQEYEQALHALREHIKICERCHDRCFSLYDPKCPVGSRLGNKKSVAFEVYWAELNPDAS